MCLRRINDQWVFVVFNNFDARLDVRVFPNITDDLRFVPTKSPIWGANWGEESDNHVAQLYGPSIVPGSTLDRGFHILLSQWHNIREEPPENNKWPYHVMQFKIGLPIAPGFRGVERAPEHAGRKRLAHDGNGRPDKCRSRSASRTAEHRGTGSKTRTRNHRG